MTINIAIPAVTHTLHRLQMTKKFLLPLTLWATFPATLSVTVTFGKRTDSFCEFIFHWTQLWACEAEDDPLQHLLSSRDAVLCSLFLGSRGQHLIWAPNPQAGWLEHNVFRARPVTDLCPEMLGQREKEKKRHRSHWASVSLWPDLLDDEDHPSGGILCESIAAGLETEVTVSVKAATSAPQREVVCLLWSHDRGSKLSSISFTDKL